MFKKVLKFGGIGCGGFLALTLILAVILAITGSGEEQTQTAAPDSQPATSGPGAETSSANAPTLAVTPGPIPTTDECPTIAEELYLSRKSDTMLAVLTDLELMRSLSNQVASNSMMLGNPEWLGRVRGMQKRMETNAKQLRRFGSDPESVRDIHSDLERMADLLEEAAERYEDFVNSAVAQDSGDAADAIEDVGDADKDIMKLSVSAGEKFRNFCQ